MIVYKQAEVCCHCTSYTQTKHIWLST